MALLQPEAFKAAYPDTDSGSAYTFPEWLANLDPTAMESLRSRAREYASVQNTLATQQEAEVASSGVTVEMQSFNDPFTNPVDRDFINTIAECMIGLRLLHGDEFVYKGNRNKGPDTPLTTGFKELSPALKYWCDNLVPTSAALAVLYNPHLPVMPVVSKGEGEDFTPWQKNDVVASAVFAESLDGRAIRSRGEVVKSALLEQFLDVERYPEGSDVRVASLACGAAEVIFGATSELATLRPDLNITVCLADSDQNALDRAKTFAESQSTLKQVEFQFKNINILRSSALDELQDDADRQGFNFVDVVGFLEYLPARTAKSFMERAYKLVSEDGVLCAANMRSTHSQLEFTTNCVRWPYIIPRSLPELTTLIQDSCVIEADNITMKLPEDGAYAVACIRKTQ